MADCLGYEGLLPCACAGPGIPGYVVLLCIFESPNGEPGPNGPVAVGFTTSGSTRALSSVRLGFLPFPFMDLPYVDDISGVSTRPSADALQIHPGVELLEHGLLHLWVLLFHIRR